MPAFTFWIDGACGPKGYRHRPPTDVVDIALLEPEIPPNTGNIIRLCANVGAELHLIHPLAFDIDDKRLRRAGLDYHEIATLTQHESLSAFQRAMAARRILAYSTRGMTRYTDIDYQPGDVLLFGPETRGLPDALLVSLPPGQRVTIPMRPRNRSLNLSNAVAVAAYEAWRQCGFPGSRS